MAHTKRELRWLNSLDPVALLGWTWFLECLEHLFEVTMDTDLHEMKRQQLADAIEDHEHVVRLTSWPRRKMWDPDRVPIPEHQVSHLSTNAALVVLRHLIGTGHQVDLDLAPLVLKREDVELYDDLRGLVNDCLAGTQMIEADDTPEPNTDEDEDGEIVATRSVMEEDVDKAVKMLGMYQPLLDVEDEDLNWLLAVSLTHGGRGGNDSATRRFHKMMEANLKALGKEKPLPISGDRDEDYGEPFIKGIGLVQNINVDQQVNLKRRSLLHGFGLRAMWIKNNWGGWGPVGELKRICRDVVKHIGEDEPRVDKDQLWYRFLGKHIRVQAWKNNDKMVQIEIPWSLFAHFWATATWPNGWRKGHLRNDRVFWAWNSMVSKIWGNASLSRRKTCLSYCPGFTRRIITPDTKDKKGESLWSMVDLVTTLTQMKFDVLQLGPKSVWRVNGKPHLGHVFRFKVFGSFVQDVRRRLGWPAFVPRPQPPTSRPMIEKPQSRPQWVDSAARQE